MTTKTKKTLMSDMFESFEKVLCELDVVDPILCPLCNKAIQRTKMGKGYSVDEIGFEIHITCVNKLSNITEIPLE